MTSTMIISISLIAYVLIQLTWNSSQDKKEESDEVPYDDRTRYVIQAFINITLGIFGTLTLQVLPHFGIIKSIDIVSEVALYTNCLMMLVSGIYYFTKYIFTTRP